jgi:hypothetical protein
MEKCQAEIDLGGVSKLRHWYCQRPADHEGAHEQHIVTSWIDAKMTWERRYVP